MKPMKIVLCLTVVIATLSAQSETSFRFQPYVGLDYQYISLNYKENYKINPELVDHAKVDYNGVSDILPTQLKGGVIYFGIPLTTYFSIETGFAQSVNAKKNIATEFGNFYRKTIAGESIRYQNIYKFNGTGHLKMRSMTLDVLGYLPLDAANRFKLIGSIGVARMKTQAKVSGKLDCKRYDHVTVESFTESDGRRKIQKLGKPQSKFSHSGDLLDIDKSETDIRLGFGAQYQMVKNLSVRAMVRYQDLDLDDLGKDAYQVNLDLNYAF